LSPYLVKLTTFEITDISNKAKANLFLAVTLHITSTDFIHSFTAEIINDLLIHLSKVFPIAPYIVSHLTLEKYQQENNSRV